MSELATQEVVLVHVCDTLEEWFLTFENHLKSSPKTRWKLWQGSLSEMTFGMTDGTIALAMTLQAFRVHHQITKPEQRERAARDFRARIRTVVERYNPPIPPPPYRTAWQHLLEDG
jgi:hypothetical protein